MSNFFMPTRSNIRSGGAPSAFASSDKVNKIYGKAGPLDAVVIRWRNLGFAIQDAVVITQEMTTEKTILAAKPGSHGTLARAQAGGMAGVVRSGSAYGVATAMWRTLPNTDPVNSYLGKDSVRGPMETKAYASCGAHGFFGRIKTYYARNFEKRTRKIVTSEEARDSKMASGHMWKEGVPLPSLYTFDPELNPHKTPVGINHKSGNGYPVRGTWETPDAPDMVVGLALALMEEIQERIDSEYPNGATKLQGARVAEEFVYELQSTRPELVLVMAKCKMDYYTEEKLKNHMMRFYNELPRHFVLIMQMATQPYEDQCTGLFDNHELHSAQKVSLVRGGADKLVEVMDEQMAKNGVAYVHVGDDSWVSIGLLSGQVIMFALDCSSFDLTQHGDVTLKVHEAFRDDLAEISPISAGVWMAFMRRRLIVVEQTVVVLMEHGGPSGIALQSKVNDVLMDIMIKRTLKPFLEGVIPTTAHAMDLHIKHVGAEMGFVVKVEQLSYSNALTVREVLRTTHFQFIGNYFHTTPNNFVYPFTDLPRTMSQLVYPGSKWQANRQDLARTEAVRLASIAMGSGVAPYGVTAQEALFQEVSILLMRACASAYDPEWRDDRLIWATQVAPTAMGRDELKLMNASLGGLTRVFAEGRGAIALWRHPDDMSLDNGVTSLPPALETPRRVYSVSELLALRPQLEVEDTLSRPLTGPRNRHHVADIRELVPDVTVVRQERPHPKSFGRYPRQKRETPAAQYARVGREDKERAQDRRRVAMFEADDEGVMDVQKKRHNRKQSQKSQAAGGSMTAARSRAEESAEGDLAPTKDSRNQKGAGRRRRRK